MTQMKVDVILLDGKRISCKFSPYDRIKNVLESICTGQDLNPTGYVLRNYFLCNDVQLRTLGLSEKDTLHLLEDFRPTSLNESVQVILEIKASKISTSFHLDVTLWQVVQCLVSTAFLEIPDSTPVLVRKNIEYIGYDELSVVTLRSLDVRKGRLFFRFSMVDDFVLCRRTAKLLGSTESLQFELSNSYDIERWVIPSTSGSQDVMQKKLIRYGSGIERRNSSVFEEMTYLGERNAVAYRAERSETVFAETDDFYDLKQEDIEMMFNQLLTIRKSVATMMLKSKARRIEVKHHLTVIRVVFPDTTVLQGVFKADEKIKDIEEFVELYRRVPKEFKLRPPKTILESEKTLEHYRLVPNGKIFYTIIGSKHPDRTAYLKEDVLRHLTTQESACYAAALCHMPISDFDEDSESSSDTDSLSSRILSPLGSQGSGFQLVD